MKSKFIKKVNQVSFQRNGISGRPFYQVDFVLADPEVRLIAIIPSDSTDIECFVINPADMDSHWRGDRFYFEVKKVVDDWSKTR